MKNFDLNLLRAINHDRIRALDWLFLDITNSASWIAILIPAILLIVGLYKKRASLQEMAFQLYLSFGIAAIVVTILKYSVNRVRPYVNHPFIEKLTTAGSPSFPSGHTADAFIMAFGGTLLTRKPQILIPLWIWACAVGYSRMCLGVHYPSDVLASIVISFLVALFGKWLFVRYQKKKENHPVQ